MQTTRRGLLVSVAALLAPKPVTIDWILISGNLKNDPDSFNVGPIWSVMKLSPKEFELVGRRVKIPVAVKFQAPMSALVIRSDGTQIVLKPDGDEWRM